MKNLKMILIFVCFFLLLYSQPSYGTDVHQQIDEMTNNQLEVLDLNELENFMNQVDNEIENSFPQFDFKELINKFIRGEEVFSFGGFFKEISKLFARELVANSSLLGKIIVLAVICAVLQNLHTSFEKAAIAKLSYTVCYLVLITLAVSSFKLAMDTGLVAIDRMVAFMQVLMPVLLTLLTALGGITSTALMHPVLLMSMAILSTLVKAVIMPLIFMGAILNLVNNIGDKFKISRFAGLIKQITGATLGLTLTIFVAVISLQGVGGAVADGVTLRTAKYMTGAFVPIAGKMFADVIDAVVGSSLLLKNAVGVVGVITIGLIALFPVLKIVAIALIYKFSAALIQPMGDSQMADALEAMSGSLWMIFACVMTVSIMFFLAIAIIVGTANVTVMLR